MAEARICKHMNEDHQLSLFMIVKSTLGRKEMNSVTVSDCKMTAINFKEAKISYVACQSKMCSQKEVIDKEVIIKFDPPMTSFAAIRPRLVELHHEKSEPKFSWLLTDPICRVIIIMMVGLGYAYYFIDLSEIARENDLIETVFGKDGHILSWMITASWIFAVVVHIAEAIYVFYLCKNELQFRTKTCIMWFMVVVPVGYPMTSKILEFAKIQRSTKEKESNYQDLEEPETLEDTHSLNLNPMRLQQL